MDRVTETRVRRASRGVLSAAERDVVVREEPLEIRVRGVRIAVIMRTPGDDDDLVRGFLFTEGVVASGDEIGRVENCAMGARDDGVDENVVEAVLRSDVDLDLERFRRNVFASSSCGVCGKAAIENAVRLAQPLAPAGARCSLATIPSLVDALRGAQPTFDLTGGVHAAGLFDAAGALLVAREDVGRHNAVDKAIGFAIGRATGRGSSADRVLDRAVALVVSGRVSFEIVQKAAAARIPLVVAVSAPSSLAVETARALGIALVGFVRGATCNVYVETDVLG